MLLLTRRITKFVGTFVLETCKISISARKTVDIIKARPATHKAIAYDSEKTNYWFEFRSNQNRKKQQQPESRIA